MKREGANGSSPVSQWLFGARNGRAAFASIDAPRRQPCASSTIQHCCLELVAGTGQPCVERVEDQAK
ncbi:hypothetical protein EMEDMD4_530095 [Sinorhizobium medicae]|uniref:Uncharacterized protein n=1 Tax=Sinorhizobium medicae TaxID=110321 RepID=A0A508X238_9HYPH|nr:hypothetical protein EMEDMD4_530095 [Sinorhizobium medicae]